MKAKTKYDVKFYVRTEKPVNSPVRAVLNYQGRRVEVYTGEVIDIGEMDPNGNNNRTKWPKSKWDFDRMQVKPNRVQNGRRHIEINDELIRVAERLAEAFNSFSTIPRPPEILEVYHQEGELQISNEARPFFELWEQFIADGMEGKMKKGIPWTLLTMRRYNNFKNHWSRFAPDLTTAQFRPEDLDLFKAFLEREGQVIKDADPTGHTNTTIEKNLKLAKTYVAWLAKKGELDSSVNEYRPAVKKLSPREQQNQNLVALSREELTIITNKAIPEEKKYLQRCRDVFVFQCHTGQRYSDMVALRKHHLIDYGTNGALEFTSIKTNDRLKIPLTPVARRIIDKYAEMPGDQLLPVVSNQKYNDYLKDLGKLAELNDLIERVSYQGSKRITQTFRKWELLTTQVARNTFVNIAFDLGMSAEVVAAITGDTLPVIMRHYRVLKEGKILEEMSKFNV